MANSMMWRRRVCSNPDKCPKKCPFWRWRARLLKHEIAHFPATHKNIVYD